MHSLFSVHRCAPSKDEVKRCRQIAIDSLASLKAAERRSFAMFIYRAVLVFPVSALFSWMIGYFQSVSLNAGLRIALICACITWLLHWLHKSYQAHKQHEQESQVMLDFQAQLKYIDKNVQDDFAQENLYIFDVLNYLQQVDAAERPLTVGELAMLKACADEFNHVNSQALSMTYV